MGADYHKIATDAAREIIKGEAGVVDALLYGGCCHTNAVMQLLLALVGWSELDLAQYATEAQLTDEHHV